MSRNRSAEATADPTPSPTPDLTPEFSHQPDPEETSPLFGPSESPSPFLPPLSSEETSLPPSPEPGDDSGSLPPSIGRGWKQRAAQLLPTTRAGVTTAGGVLHAALTVEGTPEHEHGLFLPDEDDVEAIATPLAGLASRRVPAEAANPDVTDLIALAFGVVGYVVKQLRLRAGLRQTFAGGIEQEPDAQDQSA